MAMWNYQYRDTVISKNDSITAKNHPGWNAPIQYYEGMEPGKKCYIYSQMAITKQNVDLWWSFQPEEMQQYKPDINELELELVAENVEYDP